MENAFKTRIYGQRLNTRTTDFYLTARIEIRINTPNLESFFFPHRE